MLIITLLKKNHQLNRKVREMNPPRTKRRDEVCRVVAGFGWDTARAIKAGCSKLSHGWGRTPMGDDGRRARETALANKQVEEDLEQRVWSITCPVCTLHSPQFWKPTGCGHGLCCDCANLRMLDGVFSCPTCRKPGQLSHPKRTLVELKLDGGRIPQICHGHGCGCVDACDYFN